MRPTLIFSALFVLAEIGVCVWLFTWLMGGRLNVTATIVIGAVSILVLIFCVAAVRAAGRADDASEDWLERNAPDE